MRLDRKVKLEQKDFPLCPMDTKKLQKKRHDQRENKKSRPSQYPSSSGESTTLRSERSPLGRISEVNEMRREIWNRRRSRRTTQRETTDPYNISVTSPSRKNTSCEFREGRRVLEQ
ncbi:hypothetical protein YC2023_009504 [Brassica napus]